jgi:hypothetical protein
MILIVLALSPDYGRRVDEVDLGRLEERGRGD